MRKIEGWYIMDQNTGYKLGIETLAKEFCKSSKFALNFDTMWIILSNLTFEEIAEIVIKTDVKQKWDIYNSYIDTVSVKELFNEDDDIEYDYDQDPEYQRWMSYQYGEDIPAEWEEDDTEASAWL